MASWLTPSARARLAATAAARRMVLRETSPGFPRPTSSTRSGLAPLGYSSVVSSRFPLKSPLVMARATTAPDARSRSAREAGTALPCASATARRGVSTWESGVLTTPLVILDMLDYALGKSGGRDLGRAGHQPREIVGDAARPDRSAQPARNGRGHVVPSELLEHHPARQDHAPRVHLVLPRVLGCGAVGRLEDGVPVAHVAARREPEPAHLRCCGVREQVAVQVGRGNHGVFVGTQHELR